MPRISQGLRVIIRPDTGNLQIVGTVAGSRVRQTPASTDLRLAREEARLLEAEILRTGWHGERRGNRLFSETVESYLAADVRSANQDKRVRRLVRALGPGVKLGQINQDTAITLKRKMLRADAAPRTYVAEIVTPLLAILNYGHRQGWCDVPHIQKPKATPGRTLYLTPAEAERLIVAAAPHIKPLLTFLLGTGARMSEAIELDWQDVDLNRATATFWRTKSGKRRDAHLPPAVVVALANLPHREGSVFRWQTRPTKDGTVRRVAAYADRNRQYGGQIKTAWAGAIKRAGLDPALHPHDLRHTWATWHYAINRDLLALQVEGAWSTITLVTRYAHPMPAGIETAIRAFWHGADTAPAAHRATA